MNGAEGEREMRKRVGLMFAVTAMAALLAQAVAAAPSGVVSSATGSGHITSGGENRTFAFSAQERANGAVNGQAQVISRALDTVVHMEIDCLRVLGNVAHVSGIITRSSNPAEAAVGEMRRFVVMDNGEGSESPPDRISTIPRNPGGETCENSSLVPDRAVERGNVQVR